MKSSTAAGVGFFGGIVLIVVAGLLLPLGLVARWVAVLVLMVITMAAVGAGVVGSPWGVLIDDRNKVSLSRFQLAVWTLLVLSSWLAAVFARLAADTPDPLAVAIPQPLWWLMGITTTSLVGSPLIRSTKLDRSPLPSERDDTLRALAARAPSGIQTPAASPRGLILANDTPAGARWTDMFMGEETGNGANVDMGKVQMFYFTVILVIAYAFAIVHLFGSAGVPQELPPVQESMLALLAISHAAYLTNKAIPHSRAIS